MLDDFSKLKGLAEKLIEDEKIRNYTLSSLDQAPAYFAVVPASSSGKYHPAYSQGTGGLVRHTIAVMILANHICSLEFLQIKPKVRDQIMSACALHDVCKYGTEDVPLETTQKDHPKLAADFVRMKISNKEDAAPIAKMILSHMGQWWTHKPAGMVEFIVHLADYLASRKDVEIDVHGDISSS